MGAMVMMRVCMLNASDIITKILYINYHAHLYFLGHLKWFMIHIFNFSHKKRLLLNFMIYIKIFFLLIYNCFNIIQLFFLIYGLCFRSDVTFFRLFFITISYVFCYNGWNAIFLNCLRDFYSWREILIEPISKKIMKLYMINIINYILIVQLHREKVI